jgi:hypothetical protein
MNLLRMILGGLRAALEAVLAGMLDNRYSIAGTCTGAPLAVGGPRGFKALPDFRGRANKPHGARHLRRCRMRRAVCGGRARGRAAG